MNENNTPIRTISQYLEPEEVVRKMTDDELKAYLDRLIGLAAQLFIHAPQHRRGIIGMLEDVAHIFGPDEKYGEIAGAFRSYADAQDAGLVD